MPRAPDDHLKANYGAALVMTRLSAECLVRPVAAGTDVGVDLYCESVVDGRPFLHFWVQVKTGEQCRMDRDGHARCRFERRHLAYWREQPVPVFAALVPTTWPVEREPDVYIVDVTTYLTSHELGDEQTVRLRSDRVWAAAEPLAVRAFIAEDVPAATARRLCALGVIGSVPTVTPEYVVQFPRVPVERYADVILHQIRTTAAFSILHMAMAGKCNPGLWRRLAHVLAAFGDDPHWETFAARACAYQAEGRHADAVCAAKAACKSIEGDPDLDVTTGPWPATLDWLRNLDCDETATPGASS